MPRISRRAAMDTNAAPVDTTNDPMAAAKQAFAKRLWNLMLRKNWSQSELANRAGLGRDVVNKYINARSLPTPESAEKLAQALGVPSIKLYPGAEALDLGAPAHQEAPPVAMRVTSNGMAMLNVNMEVPLSLALDILQKLPRAEETEPTPS